MLTHITKKVISDHQLFITKGKSVQSSPYWRCGGKQELGHHRDVRLPLYIDVSMKHWDGPNSESNIRQNCFELCSSQCDQMARLFFHYLAILRQSKNKFCPIVCLNLLLKQSSQWFDLCSKLLRFGKQKILYIFWNDVAYHVRHTGVKAS